MVMSSADTLNKDFRTVAMGALLEMSALTCNPLDPIAMQLVRRGAVAVLISLLANEAGMVVELACATLANLLHWEALNPHLPTSPTLHEQMEACGGRKKLLSLLTSPSASVNLAGRQQGSVQVSQPYNEINK